MAYFEPHFLTVQMCGAAPAVCAGIDDAQSESAPVVRRRVRLRRRSRTITDLAADRVDIRLPEIEVNRGLPVAYGVGYEFGHHEHDVVDDGLRHGVLHCPLSGEPPGL